jgi:subtilisin family serine protease
MLENMNMKISNILGVFGLAAVLVACPPPPVVISLNSASAVNMQQGQTLNLTATVNNAQNTNVSWTIAPIGNGTFTPNGNSATYTAPASITANNSLLITATSIQDNSKNATVTINLQAPVVNSLIKVQQTATIRSVAINTQVQFSATENNAPTTNVNWSVVEGSTRGTIDTAGNYNSPSSVPNPATATIRATSKTDSSQFGEFQLSIVASGGISGTVTLNTGLLNAPLTPQATRLEPQALRERQVKADWNASRIQGEVLLISSNNLQTLSSNSPSLRNTISRTEGGFIRVSVPKGTTDRAFAEKIALETGATVQPNYLYRLQDAPNDSQFADQANLTQIDAAGAWFTQISVPDNLIAILDTGINANHPDLAGRVTLGKDFCATYADDPSTPANDPKCLTEDNDPTELTVSQGGGHGTFATGIIAATTNNQAGIAGITQSGKVLAIKVFGADAIGAIADTVALSKGIKYAADQGAKVISMSLGVCATQTNAFDTPDKLTENAINYAVGKGAVLVAASGNNGVNPNNQCGTDTSVQFPASNPNVIAVGSVSKSNTRSSFSATGAALDLVAPGESIISLKFDTNNYQAQSGTSFAAPQVAAVAGLMLAKTPTLTRVEIQSILESTAKDLGTVGKDTEFGTGLLQAGAALSKASNLTAPSVKTSVYMYADRLLSTPDANIGCPVVDASDRDCYEGKSALTGRAVVTINGTSGAVAYSITLSRNGNALQAGTYRVVACVNKNSNAEACDSGDLGAESNLNLQFNGTSLPNINLTLAALP